MQSVHNSEQDHQPQSEKPFAIICFKSDFANEL